MGNDGCKECTKCLTVKPYDEFHRCSKNKKDGRDACCKSCKAEYGRNRYALKSEEINRRTGEWKRQNKEKARAARARYNAAHLEEKREYLREWYRRNPEKTRKLRQRRRAAKLGAPGSHTHLDIVFLLKKQRNRCAACVKDVSSEYHVDHIQPLSKGGTNDKHNLQILCPSCNHSKSNKDPIEFMQSRGRLL